MYNNAHTLFWTPTHENIPEFNIFIISCEFFFLVDVIRFFNIFAVFDATIIQPLNCERNKMFGIRYESNLFWWNNREPFVYFFYEFLNSNFGQKWSFFKKIVLKSKFSSKKSHDHNKNHVIQIHVRDTNTVMSSDNHVILANDHVMRVIRRREIINL